MLRITGAPFIALFAMSGYRATSATAPAHLHPTQTACHPERSEAQPQDPESLNPTHTVNPFSPQAGCPIFATASSSIRWAFARLRAHAPPISKADHKPVGPGLSRANNQPARTRVPLCRRPERSRRRSD
jgi:hypothetical protein